MINNKLLSILEKLSKYDLNQLRKYISSPFFNENEKVILLFDLLDNRLRSKNSIQSKEDWEEFIRFAWNKIYVPKTKYNDVKFRRLCSDLNKLVQDFLGYKEYELQPLT